MLLTRKISLTTTAPVAPPKPDTKPTPAKPDEKPAPTKTPVTQPEPDPVHLPKPKPGQEPLPGTCPIRK